VEYLGLACLEAEGGVLVLSSPKGLLNIRTKRRQRTGKGFQKHSPGDQCGFLNHGAPSLKGGLLREGRSIWAKKGHARLPS